MKVIYTSNRYGSGDTPTQNLNYDYHLFKQDWGGQESVFFNKEEIGSIHGKIKTGEILVNGSDSILYCKTQELLNEIKGEFDCHEVLIPMT
jgi:hypothetical protein